MKWKRIAAVGVAVMEFCAMNVLMTEIVMFIV